MTGPENAFMSHRSTLTRTTPRRDTAPRGTYASSGNNNRLAFTLGSRVMIELLQKPQFQVIALAIFVVVFMLVMVAITIAKFYRRCGADEALVRTGSGGN